VFKDIMTDIKIHIKEWNQWINHPNIHTQELPKEFDSKVTNFEKLMLIKIFRQEKSIYGIGQYLRL
jgi:hypothetical protein